MYTGNWTHKGNTCKILSYTVSKIEQNKIIIQIIFPCICDIFFFVLHYNPNSENYVHETSTNINTLADSSSSISRNASWGLEINI